MKKNTIFKKLGAAVLTAALATGLFATTASASGNLPAVDAKSKLTVHKFATMGDSSTPGDGTLITDTSNLGTPLDGAEFKLHKLKDDVAVTGASTPASFTDADYEASYTGVTANGGIIEWDNLPNGYYILEETQAPAGYDLSSSIPAIISLPYGYVGGSDANPTTEYNYDVHVYPKNINNKDITKMVKDEKDAYVVGDTVEWQIGGKLPAKLWDEASAYGSVKVTDPLDERLTYAAGSAVVSLTGGKNGTVVLVKDTDYKETIETDGTIVWELLNAGLEKAQTEGSTGITVDLVTTINEKAQTNQGAGISNGATLETKDYEGTDGPGGEIPEPEKPEIVVGGIIIDKVNKAGDKLANAKFKIALTEADAKAGTFVKDAAGNDIEVTTDADGYAQFMDFSQVSPAVVWTDVNTFWLVETQAPTGYVKPSNPYEVVMKDDAGDAVKQFTFKVTNYKKGEDPDPDDTNPTFKLPMTGGMGTVLFTVVGLVLMVGAAAILVRSRRKNA